MSATSWSYPAPRFGCGMPSVHTHRIPRFGRRSRLNEVRRGIIEKAVRIRLDFEVLNQPEGLALENSQMAIEAGHIQLLKSPPRKSASECR
jgi:hypothetical protein